MQCMPCKSTEPKQPQSVPSFIIPVARDVVVDVTSSSRIHRQHITCFRCGGPFHVKAECSHWRVKVCSSWVRGTCVDTFCSFAHGEEQLRKPWVPVCVRIYKSEGRVKRLGCGRVGHTFRSCPFPPDANQCS